MMKYVAPSVEELARRGIGVEKKAEKVEPKKPKPKKSKGK